MQMPRARYRTSMCDSARWDDFRFRDGDIIICTPAKCGTTWMQMICALLIFQKTSLKKSLTEYSPWLDMYLRPKKEVYDLLEAQTHRRFIKTHTPLDGLPMDDRVTYICVGRDPRDAAISLLNHADNMNFDRFKELIDHTLEVDHIELEAFSKQEEEDNSIQARFWRWIESDNSIYESGSTLLHTLHHYSVALEASNIPNVVLMHYSDMKADLETEMKQLACRLQIEIEPDLWPELVHAATFESMRARGAELAPDSKASVWKESKQFFHSGTGGHWKEFFDDEANMRYQTRINSIAAPDVVRWAHEGNKNQRKFSSFMR